MFNLELRLLMTQCRQLIVNVLVYYYMCCFSSTSDFKLLTLLLRFYCLLLSGSFDRPVGHKHQYDITHNNPDNQHPQISPQMALPSVKKDHFQRLVNVVHWHGISVLVKSWHQYKRSKRGGDIGNNVENHPRRNQ